MRFETVTRSPFEHRLPRGRHDLAFKVAFGSDAKVARALKRSRMTVWRWRHDRAPLPKFVSEILTDLLQRRVEEAHQAQDDLRRYRAEPPKPPRPLSGCCAGRYRRPKRMPRTPEEWAALGD
jgi:hypothetical protein